MNSEQLDNMVKEGEDDMVLKQGETEKPQNVEITLTIDNQTISRRFIFGVIDEYNITVLQNALADMADSLTNTKF